MSRFMLFATMMWMGVCRMTGCLIDPFVCCFWGGESWMLFPSLYCNTPMHFVVFGLWFTGCEKNQNQSKRAAFPNPKNPFDPFIKTTPLNSFSSASSSSSSSSSSLVSLLPPALHRKHSALHFAAGTNGEMDKSTEWWKRYQQQNPRTAFFLPSRSACARKKTRRVLSHSCCVAMSTLPFSSL